MAFASACDFNKIITPLIYRANQLTGFYMIGTTVMNINLGDMLGVFMIWLDEVEALPREIITIARNS